MTVAEWGRVQPSAPAAPPSAWAQSRLSPVAVLEYGAALVLMLLLSQALLGPLFNPTESAEAAGWLRTMWLPIYAAILVLAGMRLRSLRRVAWGAALVAPLILLAFASYQWSILPDVTIRRAVALAFTSLFGLWLAARFSWRELIALVAASSIVLAVGSYLAALAFPDLGVHATIHPGAWRGLWYEKNSMGAFMARGVLACGCAALMLPAWRMAWLGGAALCAGLVVLSTSTTSLLALLIVAAAFVTLGGLRRGGAVTITTAWIILVVLLGAGSLYAFAPDLVFEILGKDSSLTGRTDIWDAVLRQVRQRPLLGFGFEAFWEDAAGPVGFVRNEVQWDAPTAHNGWLELLLALGFIGVALFGLHLVATGGAAVVTLWRGPEAYWALTSLALFVLFSLSESTIMQQNNLGWALYVMTGAKLLARRERAADAPERARKPRPERSHAIAWAPAVTAPASRLSFWFGVGMVLILSRTWLRVPGMLGGPSSSELAGQAQIVYVFSYLAAAMLVFSRPGETLQHLLRAPLLLALLGLSAASVIWSIAPQDTALSVIALIGTVLVGVALASRFTWSELAEILAVSFAIMAVGSLVAGLLFPEAGRMSGFGGAWKGLFSHKNGLGGSMAMAIPAFAAAAIYNPRRRRLWTAFAVLGIVLLLLSHSKTALVAALLGGGALTAILLIRRGGALAVATTYFALFGGVALAFCFFFAGDAVAELLGKDATLSGRTGIWSAALRQIDDRVWLGHGYSSLWEEDAPNTTTAWIYFEARHQAENAHNAWLEIWLGLGLLGVILFTLMLIKAWVATAAAAYHHAAALLVAPFLLAYTLTCLTESVALTYNELSWTMFVAMALKITRWGQDPTAANASGSERLTSA